MFQEEKKMFKINKKSDEKQANILYKIEFVVSIFYSFYQILPHAGKLITMLLYDIHRTIITI